MPATYEVLNVFVNPRQRAPRLQIGHLGSGTGNAFTLDYRDDERSATQRPGDSQGDTEFVSLRIVKGPGSALEVEPADLMTGHQVK